MSCSYSIKISFKHDISLSTSFMREEDIVFFPPPVSWQEQLTFQWDEVCLVLDQHTLLDFIMKQQFMGGHVAYSRHILILSQSVFSFSSQCCKLAANTNFIVFGWTPRGHVPRKLWKSYAYSKIISSQRFHKDTISRLTVGYYLKIN